MKQKNIKVAYSYRTNLDRYYRTTSTTRYPKIQMEGRWLEELGFHVGDRLLVEYDDGRIILSPAPIPEPAPSMVAEETASYGERKRRTRKAKA